LWHECFSPGFTATLWTKLDQRLNDDHFRGLTSEWSASVPLRIDFARRQALIEIDVLVAHALGLTLDELCAIYRVQFDKLRANEQNTWYDRTGRIAYLDGETAYGFSTPRWREVHDMTSGTVSREIEDDTLPGGPRQRVITYEAPFDRCDREEDYKTAWAEFEKRRTAKVVEA
jgi:hypothetical protein